MSSRRVELCGGPFDGRQLEVQDHVIRVMMPYVGTPYLVSTDDEEVPIWGSFTYCAYDREALREDDHVWRYRFSVSGSR